MNQQELIKAVRGSHVLVYSGDGNGGVAELLFGSSSDLESKAICRLLLSLLEDRKTVRCPHCQDRPGHDGFGRECKTCGGTGRIPRK